nr:endothelin-converting enzyme homolog [Rhipicephalus microplus]
MSGSPNLAAVLLVSAACYASRILVDWLALWAYPWCDHPTKCFDYVQELDASLDRSVDPCDNFYEHVCAHWSRRYAAFTSNLHLLHARTMSFFLHELERPAPQHQSKAVKQVVSGYQACRKAFNELREDVQVLFDIFSKFSVTWPALTLPENFDVIEYLLGMSLDYNLPTPVLLTLEPYLRTDKRYALSMYIKPTGNHDPFDPEKIAACMPLVAPSISGDTAFNLGEIIFFVYLDLIYHIEAFTSLDVMIPSYTTIEALADDVKDQAPLDSLLNAINRHLPQHKSVNKDEEVLTLKNTGLVLKELLRSSKQAHYVDLVLFSGWNIVTSMNFGMSSSLLSCVSGKSAFGNSFQAVARCLQAANEVAGYALARFFVDSMEQAEAVRNTTDTWNALRDATERNFATLSWMDESTAAGAMGHVGDLVPIIPLPAHLNSTEALDAFYDYLVEDQSLPFFQWYIRSRQQRSDKYKRLIREDPKVTVYREDIPLSSTDVNAFYLPLFHIMAILPAIMVPPFVPNGVARMVTYGSIGKILGHELSHAFDPQLSSLTRTGDTASWWSKQSFEIFLEKQRCVDSQLANYTDSEVHAFNVLSEAFADTAGAEKARLAYATLPTQQGALGYSPEQLFFVAGCFVFCAKNAYSWETEDKYPAYALRCNMPVSNQKHFAEAFGCPSDAALNPSTRCTFHY